MKLLICVLVLFASAEAFVFKRALRTASASVAVVLKAKEGYTEDGYLIKPRDWFNGLSADPGDSLADPRAMPPVCKGTKILRANCIEQGLRAKNESNIEHCTLLQSLQKTSRVARKHLVSRKQ